MEILSITSNGQGRFEKQAMTDFRNEVIAAVKRVGQANSTGAKVSWLQSTGGSDQMVITTLTAIVEMA